MVKKYLEKNVYEATIERIKYIFDEFDNVLVAFSCGKDSGVMLNICYGYAKKNNLLYKMAMYYMDYEADYKDTDEFAYRSFNKNFDGIKKYWLCLPISAQCSCSMSDLFWIPWDKEKKELWVKKMPDSKFVVNEDNVPFNFIKGTYGKKTRINFSKWFSKTYGKTAVLVGIRCDESLNRLAIITSKHRVNMYKGIKFSSKIDNNTFAFYPLYDWATDDIWIANAKFGYDYNKTYDLMYQKGISVSKMRIASPFHSCGQNSVKLYKLLSPNTWDKMIGRVTGANFMNIYGGTNATAFKKIDKPKQMTWEEYALFLINTLPRQMKEKVLLQIKNNKNWKLICASILKNDFALQNVKKNKANETKREEKIKKYDNL